VPHPIRPNDEPPRTAPWDEPRRSGLRSTANNDAESSPLVGKPNARLSPDPLSTCQPILCRTAASGISSGSRPTLVRTCHSKWRKSSRAK